MQTQKTILVRIGRQTVQEHRTQVKGVMMSHQVSTYAGEKRGWIITACKVEDLNTVKTNDQKRAIHLAGQQ